MDSAAAHIDVDFASTVVDRFAFLPPFQSGPLENDRAQGSVKYIAVDQSLFKTDLTRLISGFGGGPARGTSFIRSIGADTLLTLQIYPAALILIIVFAILSLLLPARTVQKDLLPVIFAAMALVLADLATREKTAGTLPILFASPGLKSNFVWWKFTAALAIAFLFTGVALVKIAFLQPTAAAALICGSIFTAACATSLGLLSSNPKTFIVCFLMFLYLVMNDGGQTPGFDFAGWNEVSTFPVMAKYAGLAVSFLLAAHFHYRWQLRRNF
jgi:hypothetical protein